MSDLHYNGLQWENLAIKLMDLLSALGEVADMLPRAWRPALLNEEPTLADADVWRAIEAGHRESVHAAARVAIATACVPVPTAEIVYFLDLRIRAALNHVEAMFAIKDEKPVSLWAFPTLPPDEVIEWLLTEWADYHAIMTAFPAIQAPYAQSTPASSLLAPTF